MKVILREKIEGLGDIGDQISVKGGYARNYLIPNNKASIATKENIKIFEEKLEEFARISKGKLNAAEEKAKKLQDRTFLIKANVSNTGRMFGSINKAKIIKSISDKDCVLLKKEIYIKEGVIKSLGKHSVRINLHEKVSFDLSINVVS